jgi:RNA polymerase sigma factor (sigma-70 family)
MLMPANLPFEQLLANLRRGDELSVRQFVEEYEPYIRRAMRKRISQANLYAAADSADLCQSALGSFLIRIANGEYELTSKQDLEKLLFTIVRRKFAFLVRREYSERRDRNRVQSLLSDHDQLAKLVEEPAEVAMRRDFLSHFQSRLTEEERVLFSLRQDGKSWPEIAIQTGAPAVLLRKQLSRALIRVSVEIGLESGDA